MQSVFIVRRKDNLLLLGCFSERIKAENYANGSIGLSIEQINVI